MFITDLIAVSLRSWRFFIVKPVDTISKRRGSQEPDGDVVFHEELRHQELLEALRARA